MSEPSTWELSAADLLTKRARKMAEIALLDIADNHNKAVLLDRAAFRMAQALEAYDKAQDGSTFEITVKEATSIAGPK